MPLPTKEEVERKKKHLAIRAKMGIGPDDSEEERKRKSDEYLEEQFLNRSAKYSKQNKANRSKGHRFERETVHAFRKIFPDARRNLEFQKEAAMHGVDLINTGRWRVQCKRGKKYVSVTKIKEVHICPIEAGCPILLTKADNQPTLAVIPFDELLLLIKFKEKHHRSS